MSHTTTHDPYAGPSGDTCSCANCIHVSYQTLRGMERHEPTDADIMGALTNDRAYASPRLTPAARLACVLPFRSCGLPGSAVEIDTETAYGSTVRLSRSVRVF